MPQDVATKELAESAPRGCCTPCCTGAENPPPEADLRGLLAHVAELLQGAGQADLADLVRLWPALDQEVREQVIELVWQTVVASKG